MIPHKKHFKYWSYMGDQFEVLKKNLPADVYDKFHTIYLMYSVEEMFKFDKFELFRASYDNIQVTFQQNVGSSYYILVNYW